MTRQEVISSFPQAGDDMKTWLIWAVISFIVFMFTIYLLKEGMNTLVGFISASLIAFLSGAFVMGVIYIKTQNVLHDRDLPERREIWVKETFTPYLESLEKIRVPIFQKKWNENGGIDILLDTNEYKKNFNRITDFQYYESTDPRDQGYVYIKDIGNLKDFPEEANIGLYYDQYLLDSVFLPKRSLETTKGR